MRGERVGFWARGFGKGSPGTFPADEVVEEPRRAWSNVWVNLRKAILCSTRREEEKDAVGGEGGECERRELEKERAEGRAVFGRRVLSDDGG